LDKKTSQLTYPPTPPKVDTETEQTRKIVESLANVTAGGNTRVGVDVESITAINVENETFIEKNFTEHERAYCKQAASPQSSFAGRWSAKEAVFKSLGVASRGGGAALKEIEIINDENGAPTVNLSGVAAEAAKKAGVKQISVSISHSDSHAVAIAVSNF